MKRAHIAAVGASLWLTAGALLAQPVTEMPVALEAPAVALRAAAPPPLRLAERPGAQIAYLLPAWQVAALELEEIALWNRMGKTPAKIGFTRMLPEARAVRFESAVSGRAGAASDLGGGLAQPTAEGGLVWGAEVRLEDADRIRLRLSEVRLPPGTLMWVYGEGGETVGPFGLELLDPEGNLWTPSVGGPALRLEVQLPAGAAEGGEAAGFLLDRAMEIVGPANAVPGGMTLAPRAGECLVDSRCVTFSTFPVIDVARRGVATLSFVDQGGAFLCSGGLLNSDSKEPLLLTANHCFDSQASASSLEAHWDFFTSSCDGPHPSLSDLPRSSGSTLLATGASSDFTLVRLHSVPPHRTLLGWNALPQAASHDTTVHRLSHPVRPQPPFTRLPQQYSRNRVDTGFPACSLAPRPNFLYLTFQPGHGIGGTFGGSSGAPAMNSVGQVLGQLLGGCGLNPQDGCDYSNAEVDGAFSQTFLAIEPHIAVTGCVAGPTTLCLHDNRFEVKVGWEDFENVLQDARVVEGVGTAYSGLFFYLVPNNWELLVKVLDACDLNNHYWVFFAATTNVGLTVTVTDTSTNDVEVYNNPLGQPANAITDTSAFATCP